MSNTNMLLLVIAIVLTTVSWLAPSSKLEKEVEDLFYGGVSHDQKAPIPEKNHADFSEEHHASNEQKKKAAGDRMLKQESTWVEGEKKLKKALKVLMEQQKNGKNLGVPVLTRWLGDDIPVWAPEGKEKEWQAKVDAKYEEMKQEEIAWKENMLKIIEKSL